jgi:hypothetical protein
VGLKAVVASWAVGLRLLWGREDERAGLTPLFPPSCGWVLLPRRLRYVRFKVFLRRSWFGVLGGVLRGKTEPCVSERELSGLELRVTYSPS